MIVYLLVILPSLQRRQLVEGLWYLAGAEVLLVDAPMLSFLLGSILMGVRS